MLNYSKVYKHIKADVVEAFKLLMPDIWHTDPETQERMMKEWLDKASEIYGVESPKFEFRNDDEDGYVATGGGCYNPDENKITIFKKASVVSLAHEFRHMLQYKKEDLKLFKEDKEHDTRAWSVSLFRKANPAAYRRAVNRGILHFD
jgi:hypothetical protein